jgi:uncharacterized protein YjbI with pentapeptide repeats
MANRSRSSGPHAPDPPDLPIEADLLGRELRVGPEPLERIVVRRADYAGRHLASLRLRESRLIQVDLDDAFVTGVDLQDVVVSGGSWANARAAGAAVRRVEFQSVRLTGADLSEGRIRDVRFVDCRIDLASFRFSQITHARFERCQLTESDFYGSTLDGVTFLDCDLRGVVLAEATFRESEMRRCELAGVTNPERLRGVAMRWEDILAAAGELARGVGVLVIDEGT